MARPKFVQGRKTTLKVGISATETSEIILKNLVDPYGNPLTMADFGDTLFLTIAPGGENEEIISATDFDVASDGTVTVNAGITRKLAGVSPYTGIGTARAHAAGAIVVTSNNPQMYEAILDYIDSVAVAGGAAATETTLGFVELSDFEEINADAATGGAGPLGITPAQLALSKYGLRLPTEGGSVFMQAVTGMIIDYAGFTPPTGFLLCDGSSYDIMDYLGLTAVLLGRFGLDSATTFTADAASNVFTAVAHPFNNNDVVLVASSADDLPVGLEEAVMYYVINKTADTFQLSTSEGGTEVDISDAGTGTHTAYTQIKVPNLIGRATFGRGTRLLQEFNITAASIGANPYTTVSSTNTTNNTIDLASNNSDLVTGETIIFGTTQNGWTAGVVYYLRPTSPTSDNIYIYTTYENAIADTSRVDITGTTAGGNIYMRTTITAPESFEGEIIDGEQVILTTSGALPSEIPAGTYYIKKITETTFRLATTAAKAIAGATLTADSAGSGTSTIEIYAVEKTIGEEGGEGKHKLTEAELASHVHDQYDTGGGGTNANEITETNTNQTYLTTQVALTSMVPAGEDEPHNNMPPYLVITKMIKT